MCYGQLAQTLDNTEKYDPITPKLIKKIFQTDSQNMARIGSKLGWHQLEQDATHNADNPSEGVAKASVATGLGFLGAGVNNWLAGGQGGVSVGSAQSAAPGPGVVANGMQKAAIVDSMLLNSGVNPANYAGLLGYPTEMGGAARMGMTGAQKFALNQGINMMQPEQPQPMQQYRPPPQQQQPLPPPMYGMTEEEKRRLREQGYNIY